MVYYKINYLTDGTKVKITSQLFNQIKEWQIQGVQIDSKFLDELKKQDNEWLNSIRRYSRNTVAIEALPVQVLNEAEALRTNNIHNLVDRKILFESVIKKLSRCTKTQRQRFLLYHYYGFNYAEIARMEGRNRAAIRESVKSAEKFLKK